MGKNSTRTTTGKEITLTVDDRGRVTLPKEIRDRLGIGPDDEIPARLIGSVLEVNPKPSSRLQTATAGHDSWETLSDAGESLFGSIDEQ